MAGGIDHRCGVQMLAIKSVYYALSRRMQASCAAASHGDAAFTRELALSSAIADLTAEMQSNAKINTLSKWSSQPGAGGETPGAYEHRVYGWAGAKTMPNVNPVTHWKRSRADE